MQSVTRKIDEILTNLFKRDNYVVERLSSADDNLVDMHRDEYEMMKQQNKNIMEHNETMRHPKIVRILKHPVTKSILTIAGIGGGAGLVVGGMLGGVVGGASGYALGKNAEKDKSKV
jgi:hypothetical protein